MARLALVLVVAALVGACDALLGSREPRPCEDRFSDARCAAMRTLAAEQLRIAEEDITAMEIAPDPTPRSDGVLQNLGGARPVVVLVHTTAGQRSTSMCGGLPTGPACSDTQTLTISTPLDGGYHDVPCAGEAPEGCATPLPTLDPAAVEAARPLSIDRRTIPVPGPGLHEVSLGRAQIPNGVLTESRGELGSSPESVGLSSEGVRLEVRPVDASRPRFRNVYEHGWWPGTEEVEVVLVFEAIRADPGATLEVVNVVVR